MAACRSASSIAIWLMRPISCSRRGIVFNPGINEALAATALWGTQQANLRGEGRFEGVFGLCYAAGGGLGRSGEALKQANLAGTAPLGGVLALAADDPACRSAPAAHQSEYVFADAMIPVLSPAGVQEIIDYGLFGYALSRYAGTWVGLKCDAETVESTATVDGSLDRVATVIPGSFRMPPGGLAIRARDAAPAQEEWLHAFRIPAAHAFLRANTPDRIVHAGGRQPRIGIITAGKSYLDVCQALDELGIDAVRAAHLGLKLLKVACTWPLEPHSIRGFAHDVEAVLVVEEKRGLIEGQVKEILYGTVARPAVLGKTDEEGRSLFPVTGALDSSRIAIVIGERLLAGRPDEPLARRLAALRKTREAIAGIHDIAERAPSFCAGLSLQYRHHGARRRARLCRYRLPHDGRGYPRQADRGPCAAGTGRGELDRRGAVLDPWPRLPESWRRRLMPIPARLAVRAAVAAGTDITFKILLNHAAALSGGQAPKGVPSVAEIAAGMLAEGARRVAVASAEPQRLARGRPAAGRQRPPSRPARRGPTRPRRGRRRLGADL